MAVLGRCDKELLKFLKQHFKYVVYAGLNSLDAKYDQIICDGGQAAFTAVNRLIELKHRKIAISAKQTKRSGTAVTAARLKRQVSLF